MGVRQKNYCHEGGWNEADQGKTTGNSTCGDGDPPIPCWRWRGVSIELPAGTGNWRAFSPARRPTSYGSRLFESVANHGAHSERGRSVFRLTSPWLRKCVHHVDASFEPASATPSGPSGPVAFASNDVLTRR